MWSTGLKTGSKDKDVLSGTAEEGAERWMILGERCVQTMSQQVSQPDVNSASPTHSE